ncbi:MAG TPA: 30S ribosomal protein S12 methylthiotransferase RimO [Thermoanaerobaculia bacterium]|nr:30S ribosomal protein S12 methylthiotransferase RimO [Thermoanaerobaculia bacterium]
MSRAGSSSSPRAGAPPTGRPRRVGMISLGCPKNRVDSEVILGRLLASGYELTADLEQAETVIVNTCGFIDEAKQESIDTILEVAARKGDGGVRELLVAGCMAQRYGPELAAEIPEIDGFLSLDDLRRASELVALGGGAAPLPSRSRALFDHSDPRRLTTPGYAYLKVAEGCNNPCTFCAIPLWRGRFRSRTIESLVEEARQLEAAGAREICLVAQDTTRYGEDLGLGRHGLLRLIEALLAGTTVPWLRWLYAYPTTLDRELLRLMGREQRVCRYLDIPLQHSHPEILRTMRRSGGGDRYLRLLDEARTEAPGIWVRSTFIVGFPGETEAHFADLERFLDRAALDHVGAFTYSGEEGTPAADMAARPAAEVARDRLARLLERQRPIALKRRRELVGRRMTVLLEGVCDESEHLLSGRHQGMAPEIDGRLLLAAGSGRPGSLVTAEIVDAYADDLVGHIVGAAGPDAVGLYGDASAGVRAPGLERAAPDRWGSPCR